MCIHVVWYRLPVLDASSCGGVPGASRSAGPSSGLHGVHQELQGAATVSPVSPAPNLVSVAL